MLSPVNASPRPSRAPAHGSGSMWFATPSSWGTRTPYSLPVSRRTDTRPTRTLTRNAKPSRRVVNRPPLERAETYGSIRGTKALGVVSEFICETCQSYKLTMEEVGGTSRRRNASYVRQVLQNGRARAAITKRSGHLGFPTKALQIGEKALRAAFHRISWRVLDMERLLTTPSSTSIA